jgi:hypothetical protein
MTMSYGDAFRGRVSSPESSTRQAALDAARAPGVFVAVFALAQLSNGLGVPVAFCAFKAFLGIPCPGCGITTSIASLISGNWREALHANAAGPLVVLFALIQLLLSAATAAHFFRAERVVRHSRLNDRALLTFLLLAWLTRFF